MFRRTAPFLLVILIALALSPAGAAGRPFTYQAAGVMDTNTGCTGIDCGPTYSGSGSLSCGADCATAPKSGGTFFFEGNVTRAFRGNPFFPPDPCAGRGNATVTTTWSDATTSIISFPKVQYPPDPCFSSRFFPPGPCRIRGNGTVTSGALLGSRVSIIFQWPPSPCRTGSSSFNGSMTFHPPAPI